MTVKSVRPVNMLTIVVSGAWLVSFVARTLIPTLTFGASVDTAMLLVLAYWFSVSGIRKNGGGGNGNGAKEP